MNEKKRESSRVLAHSESSACSSACFAVGKNNYNTKVDDCKEIFGKTEREVFEKFAPKHKLNLKLSDSYGRIGWFEKSIAVFDCGSFLKYIAPIRENGTIGSAKLYRANFCKDRLCPTCAYRRELKVYSQLSKAMGRIDPSYEFIFLTLTVRNVSGEDLAKTITRMQTAWHLFCRRRAFSRASRGYFKALEITISKKNGSYHPHFHVIVAVESDYFRSDRYITHAQFLQMWRESYNDETIAFVNVEALYDRSKPLPVGVASDVKPSHHKAICEAAKYSVKASDYLLEKNLAEMDSRVETLSNALRGRRLIDLAGIFRKALQGVDLDSPDVEELTIDPKLFYIIRNYRWHVGISNYKQGTDHILSGEYLRKDKELFAQSHKLGTAQRYYEYD